MPETLHEILPKVFLKALSEEMLEVMVEVLYDILPEVLPKVRVIENYDLANMTSGIFILIVLRHLSKQILIFVNIGYIPDIL